MSSKSLGYFVNERYAFNIIKDKKGRKLGKLVDIKTGKTLADDMFQRVVPESIDNLVNVARLLIGAAWQDGKIEESEKIAFYKAFEDVTFSDAQKIEIEKEFKTPTPLKELVAKIKNREEKLLILEASLLLIIADNEFHPKEKEFIDYLVKEFDLDSQDYSLLYYILPEKVKQYIVEKDIQNTLRIRDDFFKCKDGKCDLDHNQVYYHFINSWKNRSTRYKRDSVF